MQLQLPDNLEAGQVLKWTDDEGKQRYWYIIECSQETKMFKAIECVDEWIRVGTIS